MPTPFYKQPFTFTNPDGSQVAVIGTGDAHQAVFETPEGYTVLVDPVSRSYCYARLASDGQSLESSGTPVGSVNPKKLGLKMHLRGDVKVLRTMAASARAALGPTTRWEQRRQDRRAALTASLAMPAGVVAAPPPQQTVGTFVGLCLLIQFPDVAGTIKQQEVTDFCNKVGYTGYGNKGSVHDYYVDNSGGRVQYTNVVTAYFTAAHPRSYYTDETISYGTRAQELIKEALTSLKNQGFNWAQLSSDASGYVYALNVFYAGDCVNNWAKGLWPHSSGLSSGFAGAPGKTLHDYQITNMGSSLTLHTFCHENGHMLCDYPDLYDYGYESAGDGDYCLMAYGGGQATNPVQIGAYLKYKAGWATAVTDITPGATISLRAGQNAFARFVNTARATEYFLVENRQQSARDAALPAAGLAIWHVDELGSNNNEQGTLASHYECALVQADNAYHLEHGGNHGDANDLFKAPQVNHLSDGTAPAAKWWNGSNSGLDIQCTTPAGALMTLTQANPAASLAVQVAAIGNQDGRIEVLSIGKNTLLYHNWQTAPNNGWAGSVPLAGAAKQLALGSNQDRRIEAFYVGTNDRLYHNWQVKPNSGWAGEAALGGSAKQVVAGNNLDGRLEVFYVGTNNRLYHNWQTAPNSGWAGEAALGGSAKQIVVGNNKDGRLEVFYVCTNDRLYHNWQVKPNAGWAGEAALGGSAKQVVVGNNQDGRLEVFYVGTNNKLYHNWQTAPNSGWAGEALLGGSALQLAVGRNQDGRLEVFYVGTDNKLYHNWQIKPNAGWAGEALLGGSAKQVTVCNDQDGRLEVFYVGTNDRLYHNWQIKPNAGWAGEAPL